MRNGNDKHSKAKIILQAKKDLLAKLKPFTVRLPVFFFGLDRTLVCLPFGTPSYWSIKIRIPLCNPKVQWTSNELKNNNNTRGRHKYIKGARENHKQSILNFSL